MQERTPSPSVDDEKQVYVEHLDYRARHPAIDERKLMRKIDFRLVPVLCILYLLAFLDRLVPGPFIASDRIDAVNLVE